ncbi:hypothetical protein ILT44_21385 [Microvirga sp. BT689]|uniref:hypothetical protein n=1 Tax=Microvirga arvi TaxID=2778731 RepID=UPI00194F199B|nr:hypothetical protein [Microvirga arvi]MBM6582763.1 hypothetical protein [Microvirga arvi]
MATGRTGQAADQSRGEASSRPVNLQGDSPELVAFALLRYLAQLEQARSRETGVIFDRDWMLDAYADCLDAVKGNRVPSEGGEASAAGAKGRGKAR